MSLHTILLVAALVCLIIAAVGAFGVLSGVNALALAITGLALFVAAQFAP